MDIRQLRYFTAVVEEGSISAAARKLHISQPPLSLQIRMLEEEYGVKLFERGARGITLTEAGRTLYQYAQEILELEQTASEDLHSLSKGKKGSLRIGLISSSYTPELYTALRRFHQGSPDIEYRIAEGNTYELLDMLESGKIELAAVRTPFPAKGLLWCSLHKDSMTAVGNSAFLVRVRKTGTCLKDLAGIPLILYRRWEKIVRQECEREGMTPQAVCVCDDARTSLELSRTGLGLAIVPQSIASLIPGESERILSEEALRSEICAVIKKDRPLSQSADGLYKLLSDHQL